MALLAVVATAMALLAVRATSTTALGAMKVRIIRTYYDPRTILGIPTSYDIRNVYKNYRTGSSDLHAGTRQDHAGTPGWSQAITYPRNREIPAVKPRNA